VTLAQSACNAHAYVKYLHRVAHIVCANSFPREAGGRCADGSLLSDADEDWLRSNVRFVDLLAGDTLFVGEDGGEEHIAGIGSPASSGTGGELGALSN